MKTIGKFTLQILAGANLALILVMFLVGYSDRVNPADHPFIAVIGLSFPVFLCLNMAFLALWVIIRVRMAIIPVAGFIICYGPVRAYTPFNMDRTAPDSTIKVLSYNVQSFAGWKDMEGSCGIVDYLVEQDADIVCLQESGTDPYRRGKIDAWLGQVYQYKDSASKGVNGDEMDIYSKFPILRKQPIRYESKNNHSSAFYLDIHGDTVIVVVNHFESICLSNEEKSNFNTMMHGRMERDSARTESRKLVYKVGNASAVRAPQADAVAQFVRDNRGKSIILCGDFNDSPISYVRHTIANELVDCYVESGNGPGISYHNNGFYVRIDNIMCSDDWMPYSCKVDRKIKDSDHYPISCLLKKRHNKDN